MLGNLTFACGSKVHIRSFYVGSSYADLMEGRPDEAMNLRFQANHACDARRIFWERKVHVAPPVLIPDDPGILRLPKLCVKAEMLSFEPAKNPDSMMSHSILVWYQNDAHPVVGVEVSDWAARTRWADVSEDGYW